MRDMVSLLDEVVFPSLSLLPCNSGVAEEVWSMLKLLPYETRFALLLSSSSAITCVFV